MSTEVKVATITAISVILAAGISGAYAFGGEDKLPSVLPVPSAKEEEPAQVTIHAELGDTVLFDQYQLYSLELDVEIDGEDRGSLDMERSMEATDEMTESLAPERHSYDILGTVQMQNIEDGSLFPRGTVSGEGHIVVSEEDYQTFNVIYIRNEEDNEIEIKLKRAS